MKNYKYHASSAMLLIAAMLLPFISRADTPAEGDTPKEVIVVGQKTSPITVMPRSFSESLEKEEFDAVKAHNIEDLIK